MESTPELIAEFDRYCERNGVSREDHPRAFLAFLREYLEAPDVTMERVSGDEP